MATGTDRGSVWTTAAGAKALAAFTPAANELLVVVHGMSGWVSGDNSVVTDDQGGTWTRFGTATAPLSTGGGTGGALWFSVRDQLASAVSHVITVTNTGDTGGGGTCLSFSGMTRDGSDAVLQNVGENTQTESPPTITFAATTLTGNPVILAVLGEDNPPALTPPTGFTEADDTGWATPTTGIEVCWDDAGNTATLFSWSAGALVDHNEIGIELDTTSPPAGPTGPVTIVVVGL